MTGRPLFPLVDKALGGRLNEELARMKADGMSNEAIGRWLANEHGIEVSYEMVRRWVRDLPTEPVAS